MLQHLYAWTPNPISVNVNGSISVNIYTYIYTDSGSPQIAENCFITNCQNSTVKYLVDIYKQVLNKIDFYIFTAMTSLKYINWCLKLLQQLIFLNFV